MTKKEKSLLFEKRLNLQTPQKIDQEQNTQKGGLDN